jgi:hypothetical protein
MAKVKVTGSSEDERPLRPALTPEARENQMISLAEDLAEQQLRDGTASSQLITHYLKLATARERLERVKLEKENELLIAKTEALQSQKRIEEMYADAIKAMRKYSGHGGDDDEEYDY